MHIVDKMETKSNQSDEEIEREAKSLVNSQFKKETYSAYPSEYINLNEPITKPVQNNDKN